MKYLNTVLLTALTSVLFVSFSGSNRSLITYVESSSGMQTIQWEGGRSEVEFADMNNDGFNDVISIGDHGSPYINTQEHGIMVYFGNGTGANWNLFQFGDFGYGGIAAGDVNNDGLMDVGYGMHHNYSSSDLGNQLLEVALGDGTGMNWTAWDDSLGTQGETWGMFTTDFGDFDNDGLLDVGSISFGCCAGIHLYKNMAVGKWRQTFGFVGGNSSMEFSFGDINNDGNLDFVVAHQNGTPYFGDGAGNFTLKQANLPAPGNTGHKGVSLGDVDNDGAKELAFIAAGGSVNVWKWNNSGENWNNLSANLPASSTYQATFLYDMNSDGFCDLLLYGNTNMSVYAGNGGGNWTMAANFTTPPNGSYLDLAVADADNNGYADICLLSNEGSGFNTRNQIRFYKEASNASILTISPYYPRGGERFKNGSARFIEWLSTDPAPGGSKVKLELSTTGSGGPWILISDSLSNNGKKQWRVPLNVNSSNCFIRYTVFEGGTVFAVVNPAPFTIGELTGVAGLGNSEPAEFKLSQNYPNPFNPVTKIEFDIPLSRGVDAEGGRGVLTSLIIYDILGREVDALVNQQLQPGTYEAEWDGTNYPSGIYYYTISAGSFYQSKKMVLIK